MFTALFTNLWNGVFYGSFVHLVLKNTIPDEYDQFLLELAYNALIVYTRAQLFCKTYLSDVIPTFLTFLNYKHTQNNVEVIRDGRVVYTSTSNKLKLEDDEPEFEFITFSDRSSTQAYTIIYFGIPTDFTYELCVYKFILINLCYEGQKYKISLDEPENYYIVNNVINKQVLCYLLNKQHCVLMKEDATYTLEVFDHRANNLLLTEKDEIFFELETYTIDTFENGKQSEVSSEVTESHTEEEGLHPQEDPEQEQEDTHTQQKQEDPKKEDDDEDTKSEINVGGVCVEDEIPDPVEEDAIISITPDILQQAYSQRITESMYFSELI